MTQFVPTPDTSNTPSTSPAPSSGSVTSVPASFPPAFLALWNDIDASRDAEYEQWHSLEHVPERVWTPGFIAGRRYVATRADQARYFTLYDLETLAALTSAAYQDLVDRPTPWSASMRPAFANFLRKPCGETVASAATPTSSLDAGLLVMRVVFPDALSATTMSIRTETILAASTSHGVTCVRAGRVEPAGPQALANLDDAPEGDEWVLLVHLVDPDRLPECTQSIVAMLTELTARADATLPTPLWHSCTHYRLLGRVDHTDVAQPSRPAPRLDQMPARPIG